MKTLTYIEHQVSSGVKCLICLETVDAHAVQISCHENIFCAECIAHWFGSQLVRQVSITCPYCRAKVDASNLQSVYSSSHWSYEDEQRYDISDDDFMEEDEDYVQSEEEQDDEDQDDEDQGSEDQEGDEDEEDEGNNNDEGEGDGDETFQEGSESDDNERSDNSVNGEEIEIDDNQEDIETHNGVEGDPTIDDDMEIDEETATKMAAQGFENPSEAEYEEFIENQVEMAKEYTQETFEDGFEDSEDLDVESSGSSEEGDDQILLRNVDDGTPEGFMRNRRYNNILTRRPSINNRSLLFAPQPDFPDLYNHEHALKPWNTLFAPNLAPSTVFTVIAEYGSDPLPIDYYYILVTKSTTVRELTRLWSLVNVGGVFSGIDAPAGFTFQGRVMGLDQTVEEVGLHHGLGFTIPAAFGGIVMN